MLAAPFTLPVSESTCRVEEPSDDLPIRTTIAPLCFGPNSPFGSHVTEKALVRLEKLSNELSEEEYEQFSQVG